MFPARGARWKLGLAMGSLGSLLIAAAPGPTKAQVFTPPRGEAQNVRFDVASGGVLHFDFDLISTDPRAVFTVLLEVSRDGGATFTLRPESLSGDAGPGIVPGKGKRILWDAGKDVERIDIDQYRFRIVATAGALEPAAPAVEPLPADPTPAVPAKRAGGGAAKWLIPLGAGGGLAAILGGRGGGGSSTSAGPAATTTSCSYAVSSSSVTLAAAGGSAETVKVTTAPGCNWTASSNSTFVRIVDRGSFTGSDAVVFSAEPNTTASNRVATLTVAGQIVTVTQIAPDRFVLAGLSPPSGSTLPAGTSTTGAMATISYFLGSRDRAYICVLPHFSASAPQGICRVQEVPRGTGVVAIGFAVQVTEPNLPVTTTRLEILVGDTPTFGAARFLSVFEPATFTWTRP